MQCKDIPEGPILRLLLKRPWNDNRSATWFPYQASAGYADNSVQQAMPPGVPANLALAKMRTLIQKGLVAGCGCGCRGGFTITRAGIQMLRDEARAETVATEVAVQQIDEAITALDRIIGD